MRFSLAVPTLGRSSELLRLLDSLDAQEFRDFEVIFVDQNDDDRLTPILSRPRSFEIRHLRTPGERGVSRGRNIGWMNARGDYVVFTDDDCWYPPTLLAAVHRQIEATQADVVAGRPTDETGRSINGRFQARAQWVNRVTVWTTQIEWLTFFRRTALQRLGGFDEGIGLGSPSPYQAAEGQDISLRALSLGMTIYYDPTLNGHHAELNLSTPGEDMIRKGRIYGRGMGFTLGRFGYGPVMALYWISRSLFNAVTAALSGNRARRRYFTGQAIGRASGWLAGLADRRRGPQRQLQLTLPATS